eukprot:COSAG06_NODE_53862_length_297_cov_1.505051_1_plen_69_part_10
MGHSKQKSRCICYSVSPRSSIPLGSCTAAPDEDAFCQTDGHQQTIVNAVVAYIGEGKERQVRSTNQTNC